MGFPNFDLILRDIFLREFQSAQSDPREVVSDLFEDRSDDEQTQVESYLKSRLFVGSGRDRGEERRVFILPHFPTSELPFPQIGIYHGEAPATDQVLGGYIEAASPVYADDGTTVLKWRQPQGYYEQASYNIDVIAATKDETIWLSRLCQYFICQSLQELTGKGVLEVSISLADIRIDKGSLQPMEAFVRGVRVSAKIENVWNKTIAAQTYATGINTAL